jgi:hypothetical protein
MPNALLADRELLDLVDQVEVAADQLTYALDNESIPEEGRDAMVNGLIAIGAATQYLLRLREQNHAFEKMRAP